MWRTIAAVGISVFLVGCATDAEMEAYFREQCKFDYVTFEETKPGTPEFEYCLELYRSGLGGYENDIHGGEGLGQFAD